MRRPHEVADGQHRFATRCLEWRETRRRCCVRSSPRSTSSRCRAGDRAGGDDLAVAQHRERVGDLEHLAEAMRDVEHADARASVARRIAANSLVRSTSVSDAVGSSSTSRRASTDRARASRVIVLSIGVSDAASRPTSMSTSRRCEDRIDAAPQRRPPHQPEPLGRAVAEHHVLGDRQPGDDGQLLVQGGDALALGVVRIAERPDGRADSDRPSVGSQRPGDDLDQRRLAGAVLAEQGVHLAGGDAQADAVERPRRPERLVDSGYVERSHLDVRHHPALDAATLDHPSHPAPPSAGNPVGAHRHSGGLRHSDRQRRPNGVSDRFDRARTAGRDGLERRRTGGAAGAAPTHDDAMAGAAEGDDRIRPEDAPGRRVRGSRRRTWFPRYDVSGPLVRSNSSSCMSTTAPDLLIELDRSRARSLRSQIEGGLRDAISVGRLAPGTTLPSTPRPGDRPRRHPRRRRRCL